jgi:signal transduction histidine kinase
VKLRYQYRLEGADRDWSAPIEQPTVNYASLSPGTYGFAVRSLNADGVAGEPATVAFTILRPVWQRWWFVTLAGLLMALLPYAFYRYRVARLVEVERVRIRIATDLHDDIGANLSRMAVLSEAVKQEAGSASSESGQMLSEIAATARGMFDAMSDIVWSVDPRRDDLRNVALRIRQFASDVLEAQGIRWTLQAPAEPEKLKLAPEQRRHVYLIFQEAITNAARHAACTAVQMSVHVAGNQFVAQIRDDGCGFVPGQAPAGNGLTNIRMRAAELGGHCQIVSTPGAGTHLTVKFPLKRRVGI